MNAYGTCTVMLKYVVSVESTCFFYFDVCIKYKRNFYFVVDWILFLRPHSFLLKV